MLRRTLRTPNEDLTFRTPKGFIKRGSVSREEGFGIHIGAILVVVVFDIFVWVSLVVEVITRVVSAVFHQKKTQRRGVIPMWEQVLLILHRKRRCQSRADLDNFIFSDQRLATSLNHPNLVRRTFENGFAFNNRRLQRIPRGHFSVRDDGRERKTVNPLPIDPSPLWLRLLLSRNRPQWSVFKGIFVWSRSIRYVSVLHWPWAQSRYQCTDSGS